MSRPTAQVSAPRSATGGDPGITRVPILAYHSIFPGANTSWRRYVVSPTLFDEHVSALREQGYVSMTVDALVRAIARGQPLPAKPVVLTFDDGFADFVSNALPVIARRHMSATLYVTTGFVGKRSPWRHRADADTHEPMLSWADVRSLDPRVVEVGAHGVSHAQLDALPRADACREIEESRRAIEGETGRTISTFCYPHGQFDGLVKQMVRAAGFIGACSTQPGVSNAGDDPFALARLVMTCDTQASDLERLFARAPLGPVPERRRTWIWRVVRRQRAAVLRHLSGSAKP